MYQKIDWAEITANNIRNILKERSLTQAKLAEMLGKNVRTVRRWVRDGIDNVNSMCQICDVLNIGIERLFFAE